MARVAVRRLALAIDRAERASAVRFRLEEALRLGADEDGVRLLLIRRLALRRLPGTPGGAAAWNAPVEREMRRLTQCAVHALDPAAPQADAVFFRSEWEARTALAALLAAGKHPAGWFWRLAVRDWRGESWAAAALPLLRPLLAQPPGRLALARLVLETLRAGAVLPLLAPVAESELAILWPELAPHCRAPGGSESTGADPVTAAAAAAARRAWAVLPSRPAAMLRHWLELETKRPVAQRVLAALLLLEASPPLIGLPGMLRAAADALLAVTAPRAAPPAPPPRARAAAPARPQARSMVETSDQPQPSGLPEPGVTAPSARSPPFRLLPGSPSAPSSALPGAPFSPAAPDAWQEEWRSEGAGLFLLIPALGRLGIAVWLERHPAAAADGFAWGLLRDIARRMRVPAEDPLWPLLPEAVGNTGAAGLRAWRVGLDRWLRRRAGRKLAEIVRRPGWIGGDGIGLVARFPLDAADIRLRRLALDLDPGWVPWLGRSVAYLYRDRLAP